MLLARIALAILSIFILSGCTDGFKGYFKKSANNKIFDTKGFKYGKRKPLYNDKYIALAKRNVAEENFDSNEDEDELEDNLYIKPNQASINRQIYREMIRKKNAAKDENSRLNFFSRKKEYTPPPSEQDIHRYPSLAKADKAANADTPEARDLKKELEETKFLLNKARDDLSKYTRQTKAEVKEADINQLDEQVIIKPEVIKPEVTSSEIIVNEIKPPVPAVIKPKIAPKKNLQIKKPVAKHLQKPVKPKAKIIPKTKAKIIKKKPVAKSTKNVKKL